MAIIVEDGAGKVDSNSYVSEVDFNAWLDLRGYALPASMTAEQALHLSYDYIETLVYQGTKNTAEQSSQWPRTDVIIDGFDFPSDSIPAQLVNGQIQAAWEISQGNSPFATASSGVKKKKVDTLEIEYFQGGGSGEASLAITETLEKLLIGGGTGGGSRSFSAGFNV